MAQGMDERITLEKLQQLKQRAIHCGRLEELEIDGLTLERALVFPSGLAILIAIFTELNIQCMTLAGGALREGLVYGMLHLTVEQDIRSRTLRNIQRRFMIDIDQAQRVAKVAANFFDQVKNEWHLEAISRDLLISACQLHEIGLSVDFKQAPQHAAYLVRNLDLPGFTPHRKNCWRRYCSTRRIRSISHRCISKTPYRRASQNNSAVYYAWPSFLPAVAVTISCQR